ncbi:SNF1-related protein kinase regulatory subunit beta-1 [Acorus gramineus]|uniref:SNF1-related protein kinase regulatory subunit beta-1 n=1 Tax=Acorus gramineus TaxID=55184 RepID=A0AAV9BY94_ACOGR|nr:SNF1-related protein kinase regulatory subunit beta-1 [Acorus gramineus]
MGNANGRDAVAAAGGGGGGGGEDLNGRSDGVDRVARVSSVDSMGDTPPGSPGRSRSPLLFAPQVPVAPLQRPADVPVFNPMVMNGPYGNFDPPPTEQGIPTLITWSLGGNNVAVEGSWDDWTTRKVLHKSGKDHTILLVLPSGIYRYKFIVDGEWRYIPDLPFIADEMGTFTNLLDVDVSKLRSDYVPENLESISGFEAPQSPDSSYSHVYPPDEDYAKEPHVLPPQLHLTVLGMEDEEEEPPSKPRHVVLNHLFIEKGWGAQSLVALGLTHRFQSKYVTVVLYKPLPR